MNHDQKRKNDMIIYKSEADSLRTDLDYMRCLLVKDPNNEYLQFSIEFEHLIYLYYKKIDITRNEELCLVGIST